MLVFCGYNKEIRMIIATYWFIECGLIDWVFHVYLQMTIHFHRKEMLYPLMTLFQHLSSIPTIHWVCNHNVNVFRSAVTGIESCIASRTTKRWCLLEKLGQGRVRKYHRYVEFLVFWVHYHDWVQWHKHTHDHYQCITFVSGAYIDSTVA